MLAHNGKLDDWRRAQGGFRGSNLLLTGAVALALGALLSLAGLNATGGITASRAAVVTVGWSAYIIGLFLVGTGFGWTSTVGVLHRAGFGLAALNIVQAVYLLYVIYGRTPPALDPAVLSVLRLASLAAFGVMAARAIGRRLSVALVIVSGAGCLKALARVAQPTATSNLFLDAALVLSLAVTLAFLARRLRRLEDDWAQHNRGDRRTDFSEFNNPQHHWNQPDDRSGLSCARSVP
jgi:hypothetical protein